MAREPYTGPAQQTEDDPQAAGGGPKGMGYPSYSDVALQLLGDLLTSATTHPRP